METALEVCEIIGFVASFIIYSNIYDNFHSFIIRLCKKGHANLAESNTNRNQVALSAPMTAECAFGISGSLACFA